MDAQRCVEPRCGKHTEPLNDAEILRRNKPHADCADEHHAEGNSRAYAVGAAAPVLHTGGNENRQRYDGQQHDRGGDDHVHDVLKCARIAAA